MSTAIKERWQDPVAVLVAALFIAWGIASAWPQPALDVSPVNQRHQFTHTTPASYAHEGRR